MKSSLLTAVVLTSGLAACSGSGDSDQAAASRAPETSSTAGATEAKVRAPKGKPLAQPLPLGVELVFPLHFRHDRVVTTKSGQSYRRVTVEFLGGDVASVADSITRSMGAAGLRAGKAEAQDDGSQRLVFRKKDFGRVVVEVLPLEGQKLRNKKASGMVRMTWPAA